MSAPSAAPGAPGAEPRGAGRRLGFSLRLKTLLLLLAVAGLPVAIGVPLLAGVNRRAVELSEARMESAVTSEVAAGAVALIGATQSDAEAVAAALSEASRAPSGEGGFGAVLSLLATRRSLDAVRFEVPSAHVSTVIRKASDAGATPSAPPPESSDELRGEADRSGVAFQLGEAESGVLVVPIARRSGAGARGYVTARIGLGRLQEQLVEVAARRFEGGQVRLLIADRSRRVVASAGPARLAAGADAGGLPIWAALPSGVTWTQPASVVSLHQEGGVRMVGAVQTVPDLGWAVALWRPEAEAYAALAELRARALWVGVSSLLFAVLVALLASRALTRPLLALVAQARLLGQRRWAEVGAADDRGDELGELQQSMARSARDLEAGEAEIKKQTQVRADLGRFLSRDLVEAIVRGEHPLTLGGERAEISVLFADVVAFTPLAEGRAPEQVVALLNELFSLLTEVVFRHGGTVDKFIGDCLMAVWGAPTPYADHAARALRAAEDMMRFLETANQGFRERFGVEVRLGIGVNSGVAIVGNIGSNKRMEYTVIGDVVNVAARLEAIAKPDQILVGEATFQLAGAGFDLALLGERALTGRQAVTRVYELPL